MQQHQLNGALPTNGRFVFYELEQDGVIPKAYFDADGTKRARPPSQDVTDALTDLRKAGLIPWDWIVDETREVANWQFAATVHDYVIEAAERARIDCWGGEPAPLVICEARSTKGVLTIRRWNAKRSGRWHWTRIALTQRRPMRTHGSRGW